MFHLRTGNVQERWVYLQFCRLMAFDPHRCQVKYEPDVGPEVMVVLLEHEHDDWPDYPGFYLCQDCKLTFTTSEEQHYKAFNEAMERHGADLFTDQLVRICDDCFKQRTEQTAGC